MSACDAQHLAVQDAVAVHHDGHGHDDGKDDGKKAAVATKVLTWAQLILVVITFFALGFGAAFFLYVYRKDIATAVGNT